MRIITGKYKGRHFDIPRTFKARPTTDFAKENIFNVLVQYIFPCTVFLSNLSLKKAIIPQLPRCGTGSECSPDIS